MENSRKSICNDLLERVADAFSADVPAGSSIVLGLSGGVDSVVLLHLLRQLSPRCSWRLSALHVHHGISPQADVWAAFCADLCEKENIPLKVVRVNIAPLRYLGIEAAARTLRYAALARQPADFIALAHHQDDQAETLLLQLLRGAGVRGVSAMPAIKQREGAPVLLRPLLDVARSKLIDYAHKNSLQWVEDESNADDAYPRNFLRHQVLPLLEQRFPAYRTTLARSARHFSEASELLDDLARQDARSIPLSPSGVTSDLAAIITQPDRMAGGFTRGGEGEPFIELTHLQALSHPRAKNLLRYFITAQGAPLPDSALLEEMLHQVSTARRDAQLCITWKNWQIRRYRGHVYVLPGSFLPVDFSIIWRGEAEILLPPPHGVLLFERAMGQGVSPEKLQPGAIEIHPRRGGEKLRQHVAGPQRTLTNLLQEKGIFPWLRDVLPLLFLRDELVCVPGVAVACVYQAQPGEMGVSVSWRL